MSKSKQDKQPAKQKVYVARVDDLFGYSYMNVGSTEAKAWDGMRETFKKVMDNWCGGLSNHREGFKSYKEAMEYYGVSVDEIEIDGEAIY